MTANQPDIIVSTSTDFAVTRRGRPVAAGRWDDVVRVRARRDSDAPTRVFLDVELPGGAILSLDDDSLGWDDFLGDLDAQLTDAIPSHIWIAQLAEQASTMGTVLVFERGA